MQTWAASLTLPFNVRSTPASAFSLVMPWKKFLDDHCVQNNLFLKDDTADISRSIGTRYAVFRIQIQQKKTGSPDGFADRKNVKKSEGTEIKFEDQIILFRLTRMIQAQKEDSRSKRTRAQIVASGHQEKKSSSSKHEQFFNFLFDGHYCFRESGS